MEKKRTISVNDIDLESLPEDQESVILLLPAGQAGLKECNRTAGPTEITGGGTQKDRGIEFDFARSPSPVVTRAQAEE